MHRQIKSTNISVNVCVHVLGMHVLKQTTKLKSAKLKLKTPAYWPNPPNIIPSNFSGYTVDWELKVTLFMLVWELKGIHDKHKQLGPFSQTIVVTVNNSVVLVSIHG